MDLLVQQDLGDNGARSLPPNELAQLRRRAVAAVEGGMPQTRVAQLFGVSRKAVGCWVRAYHSRGEAAFQPRPRGRRTGECLALSEAQQEQVLGSLATAPDELGLPCLLWTRKSVAQLVRREFGITLSGTTIDKYLLRWQLSNRAGECPAGAFLITSARLNHALVAVNNRGLLYFLLAREPFTATGFTGFCARLRLQSSRQVRLIVQPGA
ncbi:helix-turn-helix domain-containing protein [Amycolatopsis pithecellobii]|uniref:helix-turn-helix domain-containing protein n=1 Tax=Amycolatopsis pithecellobii TaxID=664692 RepID=UPI0028AFD07B|nr:helix-turn-helix domain-containing protein [Amycolatopsis pithecellobii]